MLDWITSFLQEFLPKWTRRFLPYDFHEYCLRCGECVTCNLRPCRNGKKHTLNMEDEV